MAEINLHQMQELRTQGYIDIHGEVGLHLLIDVAGRLQIPRHQLCVEGGPGETLRLRVPVAKPIRHVPMGERA